MGKMKIYSMNKGKIWSFGVFEGDRLLAGASPKYYKTKKGAQRGLLRAKKLIGR